MSALLLSGGLPIDPAIVLTGEHCKVIPYQSEHMVDLWELTKDFPQVFAYLPVGPFDSSDGLRENFDRVSATPDNFTFSIVSNTTHKVVGTFSYLAIREQMGVLEIGWILYSPAMQRRSIGTEAMFLITDYAVEKLNYRRIEWKCNAANQGSRNAALRYGHQFEGVFRQHMIVKGQNRDSAWFSILDSEWKSTLRGCYLEWLSGENLSSDGQQLRSLQELIKDARLL